MNLSRSQDCGNGTICHRLAGCAYPSGCATVNLAQRTPQTPIGRAPVGPPPVASAAPAVPPPPASDALVVSIQTLLAALGYDPGPPDGSMGPKTIAAIAAYQQKTGATPDGRPSEALRASLQSAVAARTQSGRETRPAVAAPAPAPAPPVSTFDDAEAQLKVRQAAAAAGAAAQDVDELRKSLAAERSRVLQTNEERDLNRETIKALEKNLANAEARQRDREAALKAAQEVRRQGLAGGR
jgi:hypothetical protein